MTIFPRSIALLGFVILFIARAEGAVMIVPEPDHVDVTTSFTGADIKAYGVSDGPGDLVIKVTGPRQDVTIAREKQWGPLWIGGGKVDVADAPSLLYVYATKPVASLLPPAEQDKYQLRLEGVRMRIEPQMLEQDANDWRRAFFRLKEKEGRYVEDDNAIKIDRDRVAVSDITLPSDAQIGKYEIETLLVNAGKVVERNVSFFELRQTGIEARIWNAAQHDAWTFGVICTLAAMALGFILNVVTHRT